MNTFRKNHSLAGRVNAQGVTVESVGGLGNQLFIYSVGVELSRRLGCPLYVDTTWFKQNMDRSFSLGSFAGSFFEVHSSAKRREFRVRLNSRLERVKNWDLLGELNFSTSRRYIEKGFYFDSKVLSLPVGARLRGYFQSWKYFEDSATQIRGELQSIRSPSAWFLEQSATETAQEDWVGVHVRRGDYLNPEVRKVHGILGHEYYDRALNLIETRHGVRPIKVFSDDIRTAQQLFKGRARAIEFIEPPSNSHPIESLVLLSKGSSIITANSSFSWWAAWLGQTKNRTVVVPEKWYAATPFSKEDLFLPAWQII